MSRIIGGSCGRYRGGRSKAFSGSATVSFCTPLRKNAKRLACEAYLRLGRSIPPSLRAFYISEILFADHYPAAARAYRPQPCDCRAVLIQADWEGTFDPAAVWRQLISQDLTIYAVPGKHLEILKEPHIGVLADHLKNCLNQAIKRQGWRPKREFQGKDSSKDSVMQFAK